MTCIEVTDTPLDYSEQITNLEASCKRLTALTQSPSTDNHSAIGTEAARAAGIAKAIIEKTMEKTRLRRKASR